MPARTVVIEKLSKWNGETHADITPGEYTQLTGRAGRRGLDVEGHGVVLWQPGMNPRELAGLASTRTYPLRSSFRPSYNMAVNLVHQFGRERVARAARAVVRAVPGRQGRGRAGPAAAQERGRARRLRRGGDLPPRRLHGVRRAPAPDLRRSRRRAARARRADRRDEALDSLARLKPGDVIEVPAGKFAGFAVVIDPGLSRDEPRPYVVTADRQARRLALIDFPTPVAALTRVKVPRNFNGRNPQMRRDLASALRTRTHDLTPPPPGRDGERRRGGGATRSAANEQVDRLRAELQAHPCHDCPDREDHARWAERWFKLDRDAKTLRRRIEQRTNTIARQFDRVCEVLTALDYLDGDTVTDRGAPPAPDLHRHGPGGRRVAAARACGTTSTPSELAAALSVLVFEARRPDDARSPRLPGGPVKRGDRRDGAAVGRAATRSSATTSSTSCASPTSASRGRPTAGPRATTSTTCSARPTWPPATSCAG